MGMLHLVAQAIWLPLVGEFKAMHAWSAQFLCSYYVANAEWLYDNIEFAGMLPQDVMPREIVQGSRVI